MGAKQLFRCDGETAARHVSTALAEHGLQVMRMSDAITDALATAALDLYAPAEAE